MRGKGVHVKCVHGARIQTITSMIESMNTAEHIRMLILHVGTNNLTSDLSSDHLIGELWNLIRNAQQKMPKAKIVVSGLLAKSNLARKPAVIKINKDIEWVCKQTGTGFFDGNPYLKAASFKQDGVHLKKEAADLFGSSLKNLMTASSRGEKR